MTKTQQIIEEAYGHFLKKKIDTLFSRNRVLTVATGITSSHLGDERNIREYMIASEIVVYLRRLGYNVLFLLIDDSYDPLNFRQLRVAVKKNEEMIKKFQSYCEMPVREIPDPFNCHDNYSRHFQSEILNRFQSVGIFPNIIDTYDSYNSGLYDYAKEIVFTRYDEIHSFLKKRFPKYTMQKIFWPVCSKCRKMDLIKLIDIKGKKITTYCKRCHEKKNSYRKSVSGKFSWKIDAAIKWNIFKTDFEPFSKAYLDSTAGSYYIAQSLSQEFFGSESPTIISYGQVFMDRSLSYKLLPSLPIDGFRLLFLDNPRRDLTITKDKVIQIAKTHLIKENLSFFDYTQMQLPFEAIEHQNVLKYANESARIPLILSGTNFSTEILDRQIHPQIPDKHKIESFDFEDLKLIVTIFEWSIHYKVSKSSHSFERFSKNLEKLLKKKQVNKRELLPKLRVLLSQQQGIPIRRLLFFIPNEFLHECLSVVEQFLLKKQKKVSN